MPGASHPPEKQEGAANVGWLRPPLLFLLAILAGVVADRLWPVALPAKSLLLILGPACIACALLLFFAARRSLAEANTPLPGNKPTFAIVRSGAYSFSRNPVYLAFVLLHLGVAFAFSSASLLLTLIPTVCVIDLVVIRREERYLEARFGNSYLLYKASVRRWL